MSADELERYSKLVSNQRSKLSIPQKMEMYGLWRVATQGKCTLKQPSRTNLLQYRKWTAWKKYEHLTQQDARELFVEKAKAIIKKSPSKL
ncbi:acyl-CoA binding protein, putative [Leishmania panamensis]|uniref:Acyl-CoA binding protein, putative n=4 Tax=Viannia TaxID=37616 RepID=A0A088RP71_LEIPA|nr:acyl-CoA binding protein, putative [Leishmania panamensis]AIN97728.1 acyl-CoA binding protein, putative [Leishmania panamensis]CCM14919.1 acyl-CoA binding protein, putative [Leishmania guyanensis]